MRLDTNDPRLMDYVLGELEDGDALEVAAALEDDENKEARELVDELRGVAETTRRILREDEPAEALSEEQRAVIVGQAEETPENVTPGPSRWFEWIDFSPVKIVAAAVILFIIGAIATPNMGGRWSLLPLPNPLRAELAPPPSEEPPPPESAMYGYSDQRQSISAAGLEALSPEQLELARRESADGDGLQNVEIDGAIRIRGNYENEREAPAEAPAADAKGIRQYDFRVSESDDAPMVEARNRLEIKANTTEGISLKYESDPAEAKKPESEEIDWDGLNVGNMSGQAVIGGSESTITVGKEVPFIAGGARPAKPTTEVEEWAEYNVGNLTGQTELPDRVASNFPEEETGLKLGADRDVLGEPWQWNAPDTKPTEIVGGPGTETYVKVAGVKPFLAVRDEPLSTFSIDVDTAAYSNVRRFLSRGQLPPPDAVRIEEMINYFAYAYPQPVDGRPFAVNVMGAPAPWDPAHRIVRVGIKGKEVPASERPPANLVFLLDVSGSMGDANKLPLVKESMKTLLGQLRPNDRVAIVTYAGNARKVLDPTPCSEAAVITAAINSLQSGGGTNGGGGIQMAYDLAQASFIQEGINRVIIATDGDFNVGVTSHGDLMSMIEARAKSGVFLTALGFGMGNLKDSTLEQLADRGNGNYAYIDNHAEARRALVDQLAGTLQTIAKDVKIQVEFNPNLISHYRLLGYENRALANQDFNDDTKDAGEIGAGHTVTALYEVIPVGSGPAPGVDALKYQATGPGVDPLKYENDGVSAEQDHFAPNPEPMPRPEPPAFQEWLTVKLRYKEPQGNESTKLEAPLTAMNNDLRETDPDFRFASAVAAFGQVLRHSGYRHASNFDRIIEMARNATKGDPDREAFVDMVITAKTLSGPR